MAATAIDFCQNTYEPTNAYAFSISNNGSAPTVEINEYPETTIEITFRTQRSIWDIWDWIKINIFLT